MDLRQLRYFIAIVEEGSFSRAAVSLHVAQPALSHHVRNMEAELKTKLLLRTPQGVTPTEAGLILMKQGREIVARVEALRNEVHEHTAEPSGEVRLGLPGTISQFLSVPLILATRKLYPRIRLRVAEAMSGFVRGWLRDGLVDLGLLYIPVDDRGLKSYAVLSEELALFGPSEPVSDQEPAMAETVPLDVASRLPLILPSTGHGLRSLIDEAAAAKAITIETVIDVDSYGAIKELVENRLGYSILPEGAIAKEIEAGRLRSWRVGEPPLSRMINMVYPFDRPMTKAGMAVESLCIEVLGDLVRSGRWPASLVGNPPSDNPFS